MKITPNYYNLLKETYSEDLLWNQGTECSLKIYRIFISFHQNISLTNTICCKYKLKLPVHMRRVHNLVVHAI